MPISSTPKGFHAAREGSPDIADAEDQDSGILDGSDLPLIVPEPFFLVVVVGVEFLHHGEELGEQVLGQGKPIGAGRVRQQHVFAQDAVLAVGVGAGAVELEPAQFFCCWQEPAGQIADDGIGIGDI